MTRQPNRRLPAGHGPRSYRESVFAADLTAFQVVCEQTDLMVHADRRLESVTRELVLACRGHIAGYIRNNPEFATTLTPWPSPIVAPEIVATMIRAGRLAGVGPMAAVAGAVADFVGRGLLAYSRQVVVENGGDLFLNTDGPVVAGLYAGDSPLSMKVGIRLANTRGGLGLSTSSGTVGHSLSAGRADAACVLAPSCTLADAAATAIGNRIITSTDIEPAISFGRSIPGVLGIVVVLEGEIGAWGQVELIPLAGKKG